MCKTIPHHLQRGNGNNLQEGILARIFFEEGFDEEGDSLAQCYQHEYSKPLQTAANHRGELKRFLLKLFVLVPGFTLHSWNCMHAEETAALFTTMNTTDPDNLYSCFVVILIPKLCKDSIYMGPGSQLVYIDIAPFKSEELCLIYTS